MQQIVHQLLLERMDRIRKIRSALGLLRVESRALRKKLGTDWAARSRAGFAASWQSIEERLQAERREMVSKPTPGGFGGAEEGLESCLEEVARLRAVLAREEPGRNVEERLDALDRQGETLDRSLEAFGRKLAAEMDERLRLAYDRPT
jgi:hypothetical protein